MNCNCKVAKILLEKGADIETVASGGITAIFPALYNANKEAIELFPVPLVPPKKIKGVRSKYFR